VSWHYSRALAAEYLAEASAAGGPFAQLNGTDSPGVSYSPDKTTEAFPPSLSGMMLPRLTGDLGAALLTLFLADFRVKTCPLSERAPACPEAAPDYGPKWRASWTKSGRGTFLRKTARPLFPADCQPSPGIWPKWGILSGGALWEPAIAAPRTNGNGFGYLPKAGESRSDSPTIANPAAIAGTPFVHHAGTITAIADALGRRNATGTNTTKPEVGPSRWTWPTPAARDWKDTPGMAKTSTNRDGTIRNRTDQLARRVYAVESTPASGGKLNPDWCEWLMGWPIGWTALKPLETDSLPLWRRLHSGF